MNNLKVKINNNLNENNVKTIVFNENIENVVFNNVEENIFEKNIFENQNIIIEEEVAIKDENILYKDDIVYMGELINQLLSEFPVNQQDNKFIQKNVEDIAKKIIEVKNLGIKNDEMFKKNIEYNFINNIINDKFNLRVIPITLDKHRIYAKLTDDENNFMNDNNLNIYFSESLENKDGIIEENQRTQMILLKSLGHECALEKFGYKEYLNKVSSIINPYVTKYKDKTESIGYIKNPKNDTHVLRYYDYDNIHWNTYKLKNDYILIKDVYNEVGKVKGLESTVFVKGDDANIVGFMILNDKMPTKKFSEENIISKIVNLNNKILIECKDHNLKEHDKIYIKDSNSVPLIDGIYEKSVLIIDKDNIELDINLKLIKDGNYGILFSQTKLQYDLYNITKDKKDEIEIKLIESKYNDNYIQNHNKIYFFDTILITKNDYENIIKNILPSLNQILEYELTNLEKAYTFEDINNIIKKYDIKITDFKIEQFSIIKNIFLNNLEKISNNYLEDDENIEKRNIHNKKFLEDDSYFLSNKYITNKQIEEVYGKYIHLGKPQDNKTLRLRWIEKQKDNGVIYYLNYILMQDRKNYNKNFIKNKIKELTDLLDNLESNFKKEKNINNKNKPSRLYKYQAYIITEFDEEDNFKNLKNTLLDNTVVFYKDNLYIWKGKLVKFENIEDNTLALVEDSIWFWKKDNWYKSNAIPKYENIKFLCELNNIDLSKYKLDSLDCFYRKDFGCHSKLFLRLHENIEKIKENLNNFKKLNDYQNDNILLQINNLKKKLYSNSKFNKNSEINDLNTVNQTNTYAPIFNDKLSLLIKLIEQLTDNNIKLNIIYNLIEKDGLLIGNSIYSKKYNRIIPICGHFYYFKKIEYANSPANKIKFINELLNKFSDNGESEKNYHTCKSCGVVLLNNDYDETEGFSDSGMLKSSREIWKIENLNIEESSDIKDYIKSSDLQDRYFKEILLKYGLSMEDIEEAISISTFIIKNLFSKAGVKIHNNQLINIIIDSMQKIKSIIPYRIYKIKEIKKLQDKGFSKFNIEKIDQKDTFKIGYDRYYKIKKSSIITSRFLIAIQTSIPSIIRTSKSAICSFYSFDDDEGIIYMACLLDEMNIVLLKDKSKSMDIFKVSIQESYNDFISLPHIKELLNAKNTYLKELSIKKKNYKFKNEINDNLDVIIDAVEVGDEYNILIKSSKNIIEFKKLKNVLLNRLYFLAKNIRKSVKEVIQKSPISDSIIGPLETSCCMEDATNYLNYYYYIETQYNFPIKKYIDESKQISIYQKYFVNIGSIHKFLFLDKNKFCGIYNSAIVDNEVDTSEDLINSVFKVFVDTGPYAGNLREYVGNIDIKSGLSLHEIRSKKYSIEEYRILLRNIENKNIKYFNDKKEILFEKNKLDQLKKESLDKLDNEIINLVKNISIVLNKDNDFVQKYIDLFRNFGIFNERKNGDLLDEKNKIKNRELMNKQKLDYIKKFYITKLKKYLSIIKNNINKTDISIDLSCTESDDIAKELQKDIIKDNSKLLPFLNTEIQKYFLDLNINYSNDEINSIVGMDNIYDSKYEKIKQFSNFNFNDASNLLLYIFVIQLRNFIFCNEIFENNDIYNIDIKNNKCINICKFILILFEELESDNEIFKLCEDGSEGIKNSLKHDYIEIRLKKFYKEDTDESLNYLLGRHTRVNLEELTEDKKESGEDDVEELGDIDIDVEINKMGDDGIFDLDSTPKGKEVIDQGASYGDFNEFDFETGDGFDYQDEMIE